MPFDFPDDMTMESYESTRSAKPYPPDDPLGMAGQRPPAGGHSHDEEDAAAAAGGICEDCGQTRIGFDHRWCIVNAFRNGRFGTYQLWKERCQMTAIALKVAGPPHPLPGAAKLVAAAPVPSPKATYSPLRRAAVWFPRVST